MTRLGITSQLTEEWDREIRCHLCCLISLSMSGNAHNESRWNGLTKELVPYMGDNWLAILQYAENANSANWEWFWVCKELKVHFVHIWTSLVAWNIFSQKWDLLPGRCCRLKRYPWWYHHLQCGEATFSILGHAHW